MGVSVRKTLPASRYGTEGQPMNFIHTADWQIGMKAAHVGAAGQKVRDERLEAARRVVKEALKAQADFIVVAGDTFEDNGVDRVLVQKVADILAEFKGPVYLIAGNHDPLVPGSVWEHPAWVSHANLNVIEAAEPLKIPGGVLYPCPAREKHSNRNPLQWIDATDSKGVTIGVAHGTVEGIHQEEPEYPIPRDVPARTGLDYVALGHWHSTATYAGPDGTTRMAYSGSHEPTKFGEPRSGNILLVEIEKRRAVPTLTTIRTAGLSWEKKEEDLRQPGDLARLRKKIETIENPSAKLVQVTIRGVLPAEEAPELSRIREILQSRFLYGRVDDSCVVPSPKDDSWLVGLPAGSLRDTAIKLREFADPSYLGERPEGASLEVASRALLELYALIAEAAR